MPTGDNDLLNFVAKKSRSQAALGSTIGIMGRGAFTAAEWIEGARRGGFVFFHEFLLRLLSRRIGFSFTRTKSTPLAH